MDESPFLPVRYARLIVKYIHGLLTEAEADELDEWLCASDENLRIHEDLTGEVVHNIIDPEALIEETDDIVQLWVIAGLIARERTNDINETEKKMLAEWVEASESNEKIYKAFTNPASFQKFVVWLSQVRQRENPMTGLN